MLYLPAQLTHNHSHKVRSDLSLTCRALIFGSRRIEGARKVVQSTRFENRLLRASFIDHYVGSHYTAKRYTLMKSTSRLSEQQKEILRWLLDAVRILEERNHRLGRIGLRIGIEWCPRIVDKESEICRRASLCRAIERLENRGRIRRLYGPKRRRTIALKFTSKGRRL